MLIRQCKLIGFSHSRSITVHAHTLMSYSSPSNIAISQFSRFYQVKRYWLIISHKFHAIYILTRINLVVSRVSVCVCPLLSNVASWVHEISQFFTNSQTGNFSTLFRLLDSLESNPMAHNCGKSGKTKRKTLRIRTIHPHFSSQGA